MKERWRRWATEIKASLTRRLSPSDRIYFISDLHLGDGSRADLFEGKDDALVAFLDHVASDGDRLVILGDALDFYLARTFDRVLRAHKGVLRRMKELASEKEVLYVYGNHDEDIVLFEDLLDFSVVERLVLPPDVLVVHGHEYHPYFHDQRAGAWGRMLGTAHALVEKRIGAPIRTPLAAFDNAANRAVHVLAYHLLRSAEVWAEVLEMLGVDRSAAEWRSWVDFWNRCEQGDPQALWRAVSAVLPGLEYRTLVCGHTHQPGVVELSGRTYVNTGSWTRGQSSYVLWDGTAFTCRDWMRGTSVRDELYRPLLDGRAPVPLRRWWAEHYLGWFRFRFDLDRTALPPHVEPPEAVVGTGEAVPP